MQRVVESGSGEGQQGEQFVVFQQDLRHERVGAFDFDGKAKIALQNKEYVYVALLVRLPTGVGAVEDHLDEPP